MNFWIKDDDFVRGQVPMTKFNIRNLIISHMDLKKEDSFLDIGGGTGSVSIQASRLVKDVTVIEENKEACQLIMENKNKFKADLRLIEGLAPDKLDEKIYDKVFIGGSKGRLKPIFDYLSRNLKASGIVCGTFIRLENLNEFKALLEAYSYLDIRVDMVQSSTLDEMGMLRGENPIFIVKGVKADD